jgi:hypothetical protein
MAVLPFAPQAPSLISSGVFVVEHYLAGADQRRAEALTRLLHGRDAALRHALFLPADETYFAVYDSPPFGAVAARSPSPLDRIVRAVLLAPVTRSEAPTPRIKEEPR